MSGTSAGAKQALINAARSTTTSSTGGHLYSTAASAYTGFFDIISGSNDTYFCNPSFDKVTGLGSRPCHGHREINHGGIFAPSFRARLLDRLGFEYVDPRNL